MRASRILSAGLSTAWLVAGSAAMAQEPPAQPPAAQPAGAQPATQPATAPPPAGQPAAAQPAPAQPAAAQPAGAQPAGAQPAGAQPAAEAAPAEAAGEMPWAKSQQNRIGGEVDLWAAKESGAPGATTWWALGFDVVGQIRLVPHVFLDFDVPFGVAHESFTYASGLPGGGTYATSSSQFVFGNITVGAHYGANALPNLAWYAGGTLSLPTQLWSVNSGEVTLADSELAVSRAGYDLHRFIAERFPIRGMGGVEWRILPVLYYRADLAPAVYVALHDRDESEFYVDQGNEIEARAPVGVGGGLRLQETFFFTDDDLIQTAIEPYFAYESPGRGVYARVGLLVALDPYLGFGLDHGKVATLRAAVGGKF